MDTYLKNQDTPWSFCCHSEVKTLFVDYIKKARKDGICMIFVYAPFYIETLQKVPDLDKCYATFDSIAQLYDIPILDYTYSSISTDTTYFFDAFHLNQQGAELFSTILARDLDSLNLVQ